MTAVQMQGACLGCGGLLAGSASTSCRTEHHAVSFSSHTGATEGAVEMDLSRRYIRYPILLGRGACKRVYKGMLQNTPVLVKIRSQIRLVCWNVAELTYIFHQQLCAS
jgi:hypothetical protein